MPGSPIAPSSGAPLRRAVRGRRRSDEAVGARSAARCGAGARANAHRARPALRPRPQEVVEAGQDRSVRLKWRRRDRATRRHDRGWTWPHRSAATTRTIEARRSNDKAALSRSAWRRPRSRARDRRRASRMRAREEIARVAREPGRLRPLWRAPGAPGCDAEDAIAGRGGRARFAEACGPLRGERERRRLERACDQRACAGEHRRSALGSRESTSRSAPGHREDLAPADPRWSASGSRARPLDSSHRSTTSTPANFLNRQRCSRRLDDEPGPPSRCGSFVPGERSLRMTLRGPRLSRRRHPRTTSGRSMDRQERSRAWRPAPAPHRARIRSHSLFSTAGAVAERRRCAERE